MKIQVNVSDEFVKRLDAYANRLGVTRSSLCAVWLAQTLERVEKSDNVDKK